MPSTAPAGTTHPMQLPVLRETRMVAVWCEIGPRQVVEATPAIARAVVRCCVDWAAAPVELTLRLTTAFSTPCGQSPGCWIRSPAAHRPVDPLEVLEARESITTRPRRTHRHLTRSRADPTGLFELEQPGRRTRVDAAGVRSGSRASSVEPTDHLLDLAREAGPISGPAPHLEGAVGG